MASVLGMNCKAYRNTASYASPTWNEVTNIRDLSLSLEADEADVTTRGNNGWKATVQTLKDSTVEFQMVWDTADADFTAIQSAFLGNTSIEFAFMDGSISTNGSQGLRATMMVTNFSRTENLTEAVMVDVSVKATYADNAPAWYTVGS